MNKKAQEMKYVIFLSLFICIFGILSLIFTKSIVDEKVNENSGSFFETLFESVNDFADNIPVIGSFIHFITYTVTLIYIHPYLALFFGAFLGAPLGYLILRLVRGGG